MYKDLTIEILNNTEIDITQITLKKDENILKIDYENIQPNENRQYIVNKRGIYIIEGTLRDGSTFYNAIDLTEIEKKTIKVKSYE